jgi:hypothetical protein
MSIVDRLDRWKEHSAITAQQHALFTSLVRDEPFSLFAELNVLLYAGVLAFVVGLGWTVTTYSRQFGDVLVVTVLAAIIAACLWHSFSHAAPWSREKTLPHSFLSDYILYLCCLVWGIELAYLEQRLYLFPGHWDLYLLATALFFFFLAYRFDNRLVLSLALSSLAGWFGFSIAKLPFTLSATYRQYALSFCLCVFIGAAILQFLKIKPHFFATYLNLIANVFFIALLSGVFDSSNRTLWFLALLLTAAASLAWGITKRQFAFVAYASVYTYIGAASLFARMAFDPIGTTFFLIIAAIAMLVALVVVSRNFGKTQ